MAEVTTDPVTIYPCPLPGCQWATVSEPAGPAENEGALAEVFGWGVYAATARAQRLQRKEQEITDHLSAEHTFTEAAIALALANKRVGELEQLAAEILATFNRNRTEGGHRARVGQVQIQKWHARLNPAEPWNPGGGGHG